METAEPVSYEFPGHAVGAVAPRRMMGSNVGHNFPFYTNPTGGYTLPFHQSSSPAYSFGHTLNHHHHHHHHHPGYQHYFVAGQQPINPQPVRLSSEPPSIQQIPDIRPAKNAVNRVARDPLMKVEHSGGSQQPPGAQSSSNEGGAQGKSSSSNEVEFSTEVDILMKAIQAKASAQSPAVQSLPPLQQLTHGGSTGYPQSYTMPVTTPRCTVMVEEAPSRSGKKRKYACTLPQCGKSFAQKTHLDIHMRAHTGDKPFVCKEPSCGQRFSQLGNLKTHQRRHTGEKPFSCDICQKRFAQRGNVRAHKITHQHAKPFTCLLDDCGKQFTQLGNLKSHQNKFHATTLRNLTLKFSQVTEGDHMSPQDRKLWEYFATLYKNSNKGIKGRGKDRRISPTSRSDPGSGSRRRIQPLSSNDDKMRRASYEDTSMYNGGSSSDDDDAEPYYIERQAH
ncbi:hypothetical protein ASPFODRAFT_61549 [Aspergillus luchuensis CBS 106.47]|uniref:C2H2-type domain-containing protein n=1 Tax=Aspergillus luchuensis (strain CBS 106.47) TaxID=1137211 RepID=A0A1M3THI5_ASPLC|nr:hypothetical protein ASPFODRAFT_61549 [Aspergillus luchuensis CBS 106.47]